MPAPTNVQSLTSGPTMMMMNDGTYVPVSRPSRVQHGNHQKLLIVIQYYDGDKSAAEDLGALIAGLERVRNHTADIMIFRRFDALDYSNEIIARLRDKFDKVFVETSRRRDAKGYPFGPNQMWADIVGMVSQMPQWRDNYFAFLPLESDCVPVHPNWINELSEEFRFSKAKNYSAIGHIHETPVKHMNGVGVYDSLIWSIVGGNKLNGANPQVAYDIYHSKDILPLAYDTPLIMMQYQRPTITPSDLFKKWKNGVEPALFHGVKDGSARAAVRAKYITFSDELDMSKRTVFTYQHERVYNPSVNALYEMWADGWKSRGWNPVKLSLRDAARETRYSEVMKNVDRMKFFGSTTDEVARLIRWVALEAVGGGLMVDPDVLPTNFNPVDFKRTPALLNDESNFGIIAAYFDMKSLGVFLDAVTKYPVDDEARLAHADFLILKKSGALKKTTVKVAISGSKEWRSSPMVSFNQFEMQRLGIGGMAPRAMEKFLREN